MLVDAAVRLCCTYQINNADDQNSLQPITVNKPLSHSSRRPPQTLVLSRLLYSQMCVSGLDKLIPLMRREMRASSSSRGRPVTLRVSQWGMMQSLHMFAGVNLHNAHANDQRRHIIHMLRLCLFYLTRIHTDCEEHVFLHKIYCHADLVCCYAVDRVF